MTEEEKKVVIMLTKMILGHPDIVVAHIPEKQST